jgi:hypothetical protein
MIKFVEFTCDSVKSLINVNHIILVRPVATNYSGKSSTKIWFDDGTHTVVDEQYSVVCDKLREALT